MDEKEILFKECPICHSEIIESESGIARCKNGHSYKEMLLYYKKMIDEEKKRLLITETNSPMMEKNEPKETYSSKGGMTDIIVVMIFIFCFMILHESLKLYIVPFWIMLTTFLMFLIGTMWRFYREYSFNQDKTI